jgi:hypothetical protein
MGVVTVTHPLVAPAGTVALISVAETTVKVAEVPLKLTAVAPVRLSPRMITLAPVLLELGIVRANGRRPTDNLKAAPQPK